MVFCGYCGENVKPNIYFSWNGFIRGLGIFYLIYILSKIPQCPNCNFPMPRRAMAFAVHMPQFFVKLAGKNALHLNHSRDGESASREFYLKRQLDLSQYLTGLKIRQSTSLNTVVNEVHGIGQKTMNLGNNIWACDLYDKETIKIFDQLGGHIMACEKDERS